MPIDPQDLVLEIGSGHNPHPRADVLCDKHFADDTERGGRLVVDRPLVIADAEALPFRDGTFDYILCTHVLEHAQDIVQFISELERVGRAGYIETPSEIGERLYGWPYHRWLVNRVGDRLVLRPKVGESPFGVLFHRINATDPDFARLHDRYHPLLLVRYEWEERIDFEVREPEDAPIDLTDDVTVDSLLKGIAETSFSSRVRSWLGRRVPAPWRERIRSWRARSRGARRIRPDLRDLLVCPRCHGSLEWRENVIDCPRDGLTFPIRDGVPILLLSEATRRGATSDTDAPQ